MFFSCLRGRAAQCQLSKCSSEEVPANKHFNSHPEIQAAAEVPTKPLLNLLDLPITILELISQDLVESSARFPLRLVCKQWRDVVDSNTTSMHLTNENIQDLTGSLPLHSRFPRLGQLGVARLALPLLPREGSVAATSAVLSRHSSCSPSLGRVSIDSQAFGSSTAERQYCDQSLSVTMSGHSQGEAQPAGLAAVLDQSLAHLLKLSFLDLSSAPLSQAAWNTLLDSLAWATRQRSQHNKNTPTIPPHHVDYILGLQPVPSSSPATRFLQEAPFTLRIHAGTVGPFPGRNFAEKLCSLGAFLAETLPHVRLEVSDSSLCACDIDAEKDTSQLKGLKCLSALSISMHANKRTTPTWMGPLSSLSHLTRLHFAQSIPRHPYDTGLLLGLGFITQLRQLSLGMCDGGVYMQDLAGLAFCTQLTALVIHRLNVGTRRSNGQEQMPPMQHLQQQEHAHNLHQPQPLQQGQRLHAQQRQQQPVATPGEGPMCLFNLDAAALGLPEPLSMMGANSPLSGSSSSRHAAAHMLCTMPAWQWQLSSLHTLVLQSVVPGTVPLAMLAPNLRSLSLPALRCTSGACTVTDLSSLYRLTALTSLELKMLALPLCNASSATSCMGSNSSSASAGSSAPKMRGWGRGPGRVASDAIKAGIHLHGLPDALPGCASLCGLESLQRLVLLGWHSAGSQMMCILRSVSVLPGLTELQLESCGPMSLPGTWRSRLLARDASGSSSSFTRRFSEEAIAPFAAVTSVHAVPGRSGSFAYSQTAAHAATSSSSASSASATPSARAPGWRARFAMNAFEGSRVSLPALERVSFIACTGSSCQLVLSVMCALHAPRLASMRLERMVGVDASSVSLMLRAAFSHPNRTGQGATHGSLNTPDPASRLVPSLGLTLSVMRCYGAQLHGLVQARAWCGMRPPACCGCPAQDCIGACNMDTTAQLNNPMAGTPFRMKEGSSFRERMSIGAAPLSASCIVPALYIDFQPASEVTPPCGCLHCSCASKAKAHSGTEVA